MQNFKGHTHLIKTTPIFSLFLARKYLLYQPIELFSIVSLPKHAKVSQTNRFLNSLAREEGSIWSIIRLSSYFLVLASARKESMVLCINLSMKQTAMAEMIDIKQFEDAWVELYC